MNNETLETLQDRLKSMPRGHWLFLNPPNYMHLMAGTRKAGIRKNGLIQLEYQDGLQESRKANKSILQTPVDDLTLFMLVSYVQDARLHGNEPTHP